MNDQRRLGQVEVRRMQVLARMDEGRQPQMTGAAGFEANPLVSSQATDFAVAGADDLFKRADGPGARADHFPGGWFAEFIPMGMTTSFGDGSRATLKMLRQFANLPHILCFGRLCCKDAPGGGQILEFVPVGVATSFGQGGRATLEMLSRLAHIPHVLCFGQLQLQARPRR